MASRYYVYIVANGFASTHVGMTDDIRRRVAEHKDKPFGGLPRNYNLTSLVYLEEHDELEDAAAREKQIKGWSSSRKIELIEQSNPNWDDLSDPSISPGMPHSPDVPDAPQPQARPAPPRTRR